MDYHEAIEYMRKELHKQCVNSEGQDAYIIAISAMKELQLYKDTKLCLIPEDAYGKQCEELDSYKQLGALEEVREAVEKHNECKNCAYKIHSDRISKLNNCNDCGLKNTCVKRPEYGDYCRINCYDWSEEE